MTNSSRPPDYSTILTSDDIVTITGYDPTETLTINSPTIYDYSNINTNSVSTISITGGSSGSYISSYGISTDTISFPDLSTFRFPQEWESSFPDFDRVQDMCKMYPGLEIALKKFREVYTMVKDDYDALKNQNNNS